MCQKSSPCTYARVRSLPSVRLFSFLALAFASFLRAEDAFDHFREGERLLSLQQAQQAIGPLHKAAQQKPAHPKAALYLGMAYLQTGRYTQAIQWLQNPPVHSQEYAHLYAYNLGNVYFVQHRYEEAQHAYEQALALKHDYPPALLNRANTAMKRQAYAHALADYKKYVSQNPTASQHYEVQRMIAALEQWLQRKEAEEARRKEAEEARRKEAEEARRKEAEEARRKEAEEARRKEAEEARRKEAEEARRKEAEEARRKEAEEARRKEAEEARRKEAEEARRKEAEEARRKEAEEARRKEAEEARRKEAEEARRKEAEEARRKEAEEARRKEAEEARRKEAEEARRKEAEFEALKRALRLKQAEDARTLSTGSEDTVPYQEEHNLE
ncbi:tetratricopeptide repeat protein [Treponema pallidum]|nr:tetratricopeptide repeat protein [Treponema pallidum]UNE12486.1 tetratricopeptide repeat protein [Treponema pallidum]UNH58113.1 tetratricopeptide repeat protein [Treponema pallidum]UNH58814.1 tetratricopeptide repeat protein [Treponema pallidum]UNN25292.1 tetratricopeptide repeat protein [Treponema pallidum]